MSAAVGMDGCKAGWFYFRKDGEVISHGVVESFHKFANSLPIDSRIFVDIPIGLIDTEPGIRICDQEARKLLGRAKAATVFSAPCRPVLEAKSYEEAKEISLRTIGKKLSIQTFNITPKIKEVDDFMLNQSRSISVREVHPELCFWALNNRSSMISRKKDVYGFKERLLLLKKFVPDVDHLVNEVLDTHLRRDVAKDDVLDALVAMITATTSDDALRTIPISKVLDSKGRPMEMVFTEQPNDRAI